MTDSSTGPKGGKKGRKHGRNKAGCATYKSSNNATLRKAMRIVKHLKCCRGEDISAISALANCIKADSQTSKALKGVSLPLPLPTYIKRMAYDHKRLAKAKRQYAAAEASGNDAARMKAGYYIERFSP